MLMSLGVQNNVTYRDTTKTVILSEYGTSVRVRQESGEKLGFY
jgi:hypothetical protein